MVGDVSHLHSQQEFFQSKEERNIIDKIKVSKINLINRKYQLGVALFKYSMYQEEIFYSQAITLSEQCLSLCRDDSISKTNLIRKIMIYTKIAYCHIKTFEYKEAAEAIDLGQVQFKLLQEGVERNDFDIQQENIKNYFLNIFNNMPLEVVYSHLLLVEAIIELIKLNINTACQLLTRIMENGKFYDPKIRK